MNQVATRCARVLCLLLPLSMTQLVIAADPEEMPPEWAYPTPPANLLPRSEDGVPRHVPDSSASYSVTQLRNPYIAPLWHPEDSPPLPAVVARGHQPEAYACGYCHRADGPGGPENAGIRGLPAAYIIEQLSAFRSGERKSSLSARVPFAQMAAAANSMTADEMREVAAFYSAMPRKRVIRVVEAVSIPKPRPMGWFYAASQHGEWEALGQRILEVPVDLEQFENRDGRAKFLAYVPVGSIARGERLVRSGRRGNTLPCASCHGPDLKGLAAAPPIAGSSPSYIVRQLFDIKAAARTGPALQVMQAPVAKLRVADMIDIAAYLASLAP